MWVLVIFGYCRQLYLSKIITNRLTKKNFISEWLLYILFSLMDIF